MARMWFPDASAGEDDNDYIEKQISELAAKGFGGVEMAMIMTFGVRYYNEDTRIYGWGTDNWIKLMKKVLKAAAKVPGGFQVDATITSHWPPLLNTIDPNDEAASKELSFSVTPITADDIVDNDAIEDMPTTDRQPASSSAAINNIQGQRLGTPQRSVNIVKGKKAIHISP